MRGRRGGKGKKREWEEKERRGEVERRGGRPTFSLVYATPLLQNQAQLGLNPAPLKVSSFGQASFKH